MPTKKLRLNSEKIRTSWPNFLVTIAIISSSFQGGHSFLEGDTLWHIKNGLWILNNHTIPMTDHFSWTAVGKSWTAHEWLWDLLSAFVWQGIGKIGLWVLMLLGIIIFGTALYVILKSKLDSLTASILTAMVLFLTSPWWCARPHVLASGLFALWIAILYLSRKKNNLIYWMVPISVIWVNIHSSVVFGIGLLGIYLIILFLTRSDIKYCKTLFYILIFCLVSICISPQTYHIYSYSLQASSNPLIVNNIGEWQSPNFHQIVLMPILIILFLVFSLIILRIRSLPLFDGLLIIITLIMTLMQVRQAPFFYFASAITIADLVPWNKINPISVLKPLSVIIFIIALYAALPLKISWLDNPRDGLFYPEKAVMFIKKNNYTYHVFNEYSWGGYLIYNDIKPFIDGRADLYVLAGTTVLQDYLSTLSGDRTDPQAILDHYQVKTILITPYNNLRWYLDRNSKWKQVFRNYAAVVYVRR